MSSVRGADIRRHFAGRSGSVLPPDYLGVVLAAFVVFGGFADFGGGQGLDGGRGVVAIAVRCGTACFFC